LELHAGAEVRSEQRCKLGGVVSDVHVAADDSRGSELLDDGRAVHLHRLASQPRVRQLQAVVGACVHRFGG
jgi:hypothetical protein